MENAAWNLGLQRNQLMTKYIFDNPPRSPEPTVIFGAYTFFETMDSFGHLGVTGQSKQLDQPKSTEKNCEYKQMLFWNDENFKKWSTIQKNQGTLYETPIKPV